MPVCPKESIWQHRSAMVWHQAITHDDVIKWKHFRRYWPFVRGIYRSPVNSPHKGQWRRVLMFPLIFDWINSWVNNREAGDLRRHRTHYDVIVMMRRSSASWRGTKRWQGTCKHSSQQCVGDSRKGVILLKCQPGKTQLWSSTPV